eukprot:TRINITY_DN6769_c0_g1_i1.p1 TRINITY_DN6769_c0_g1~~TRINITY_DN6769_c0_g1_i1.p1  ORF type:complete len:529 (-),score=109.84 TRINITY_DN6769_c0_g1_i1:362-1948(-)
MSAGMDMDMFHVQQTVGHVLCCLCGTPITPNPSNMCVGCVRSQVDITEGLQRQITVLYCRECGRYLQPPRTWIKAALESKELLTFCIKRVKNLQKVKLVDAGFVWTEPHSKRLKVKLTIQKEVFNGAILQQAFVIEYVVEDHMCEGCSKIAANPDQWIAVVQVRQKAEHRRTFFFLEQLILKHGADAHAINIKQMHDGLDFFYGNRSHALKLVDFLNAVVPMRHRSDKQLVSHDSKSNEFNYKYTFSVEICPICKDDLVCLPPKASSALGGIGPLVLCSRVSNSLLLLDPNTLRTAFVDAGQFWRHAYRPLMSSRQLVEYVVLDVEVLPQPQGGEGGGSSGRWLLAEVQVARAADFGKNDTIFYIRTHLGHMLNPGDMASGYDLYGANMNSSEVDSYKNLQLPDVVLVKKSYEEKRKHKRGKPRPWKLKALDVEMDGTEAQNRVDHEREERERERFMEELEEDPDLRSRIVLYRDPNYVPRVAESDTMTETDGGDIPEVPLEELLSDLRIDGHNGKEDDEGSEGDMQM